METLIVIPCKAEITGSRYRPEQPPEMRPRGGSSPVRRARTEHGAQHRQLPHPASEPARPGAPAAPA